MSAMIGVSATFSASHYDEVRRETHGHSYVVTAWYPADPPRDAVMLQVALQATVKAAFDHQTLPPELSRAEALASALMGLIPSCIGVDVARPVEGLFAQVRA